MPKIRIREKDLTTGSTPGSSENFVFITDTGATNGIKVLTYGDETQSYTQKKKTIDRILNLGGKVLVCDTYEHAATYLKDRNQFDVKFLLVDEQSTVESGTKSDLEYALGIAVSRRDCVVVYNKTTDTYSTAEQNLLKAQVGGDTFLGSEQKSYQGKYVIPMYASSAKINTDEVFSAGEGYILAFLNNVRKGKAEWLATAGSERGLIPVPGLTVGFMTEDQIESMQKRSGDGSNDAIAINPICSMNPWGVRIWGNRTALPIPTEEGDTDLVATSCANVRILLCDLKKALYRSARQYQFEQNSDVLWVNFQSSVNNLLEEMKQSYGIAGYKWIKETTPERAKLKATLRIIPMEAVEDFDLTLELADSLEITE